MSDEGTVPEEGNGNVVVVADSGTVCESGATDGATESDSVVALSAPHAAKRMHPATTIETLPKVRGTG